MKSFSLFEKIVESQSTALVKDDPVSQVLQGLSPLEIQAVKSAVNQMVGNYTYERRRLPDPDLAVIELPPNLALVSSDEAVANIAVNRIKELQNKLGRNLQITDLKALQEKY